MSGIIESTKNTANDMVVRGLDMIDNTFPPKQRANVQQKIQNYANANPKLSAFILANVVLSGVPLITFLVFSLSVFVFSSLTALVVGTLFTVFVTLSAIGFALMFFLPTLLFTTAAATFLWTWGTATYLVFQYFNREDTKESIRSNYQTVKNTVSSNGQAAKNKAQNLISDASEMASQGADKVSQQAEKVSQNAPRIPAKYGSGQQVEKPQSLNGSTRYGTTKDVAYDFKPAETQQYSGGAVQDPLPSKPMVGQF